MFLISLLLFMSPNALADYPWGYPYQGYSRGHSTAPIISLDLDPQHITDSSFRIAVREDRLDHLQRLIQQGADVDSQSDTGQTALMYASRNCSAKAVQFLLKHGANTNICDGKGRTALILASGNTCEDVVKLLVSTPETKISTKDDRGRTALDYAKDASALEVDGPTAKIMNLLRRSRKEILTKKDSGKIKVSMHPLREDKHSAIRPIG